MESKSWIKEYVEKLVKDLNEQYPGIISNDKTETFIKTLQESNSDNEHIIMVINATKEEVINNYQNHIVNNNRILEEPHYDLNELFDCRITNNTLHIHVVPKSVKEDWEKMGHRNYLINTEEKLVDAFEKIGYIIRQPENTHIDTIFAVSPQLTSPLLRKMFQKYDFEASLCDNPYFIEMFKTERIGQAMISRNKFLTMLEERNIGDGSSNINHTNGTIKK